MWMLHHPSPEAEGGGGGGGGGVGGCSPTQKHNNDFIVVVGWLDVFEHSAPGKKGVGGVFKMSRVFSSPGGVCHESIARMNDGEPLTCLRRRFTRQDSNFTRARQ